MPTLEQLRKEIDTIDADLVRLLNHRAELVLEVKATKEKEHIDIYSPAREQEILDRVGKLGKVGKFPQPSLEKVFRAIISATRSLIGELVVGYLGPEFSPAQEAAMKQFGGDVKYQSAATGEDVCRKVERGEVHFGVVPVETNTNGLVASTFHNLLESNIQIVAEIELKQNLAVLGKEGTLAEAKRLYSDAFSFVSATKWVKANLSTVELVLVDNTAIAAKLAAAENHTLAVASETMANRFGLQVLASHVEDDASSGARFVVVGYQSPGATGRDKTSLICAVNDRSGALCEILKPFAHYGLTLTKIESKPMPKNSSDYMFIIDIAGHISQPPVAAALHELRQLCTLLKVLGSYPMA